MGVSEDELAGGDGDSDGDAGGEEMVGTRAVAVATVIVAADVGVMVLGGLRRCCDGARVDAMHEEHGTREQRAKYIHSPAGQAGGFHLLSTVPAPVGRVSTRRDWR